MTYGVKGIIIDSLSYPFSNWMRFLFLGIVVLISFSQYTVLYLVKINFLLFICLDIMGFLFVGSFVRGYLFKIINKSLTGISELPVFNDWINIFIDGIKVLIVNIIYLIPVILITLSLLLSSGTDLRIILTSLPDLNLDLLLYVGFTHFIPVIIAFLYLILIIPVILMSIVNMAYNDGKLSEAFKFGEIFVNVSKLSWDRITWYGLAFYGDLVPIIIGFFIFDEILERIYSVGWKKLIIWYFATGIIALILIFSGYFVANITSNLILNGLELFSLSNYNILRILILSLVLLPYLFIFLSRSTALIYNSAIKSYWGSESYTSNYELQQE